MADLSKLHAGARVRKNEAAELAAVGGCGGAEVGTGAVESALHKCSAEGAGGAGVQPWRDLVDTLVWVANLRCQESGAKRVCTYSDGFCLDACRRVSVPPIRALVFVFVLIQSLFVSRLLTFEGWRVMCPIALGGVVVAI